MFYTYLWLREDGTPYYVGKGKGDRGRVSDGHGVKCPSETSRIIIQNHNTEEEAFEAEKFLILYYGRLDLNTGCLRNLTEGGEGVSGHIRTETHKKNLSISCRGKKDPPQALVKRSEKLKGKPWTDIRRQAECSRARKVPTCHPERKHKAKGLCKPCAYRVWALENRIGRTHE